MICFNCGECILPADIATVQINDENENILEKKVLCQDCAKSFALELLKVWEKYE